MKEYICECCNKKWQSKTHYNRHMKTNKITGEPRKKQKVRCDKQIFACDVCGKVFRNNYCLNSHTLCRLMPRD